MKLLHFAVISTTFLLTSCSESAPQTSRHADSTDATHQIVSHESEVHTSSGNHGEHGSLNGHATGHGEQSDHENKATHDHKPAGKAHSDHEHKADVSHKGEHTGHSKKPHHDPHNSKTHGPGHISDERIDALNDEAGRLTAELATADAGTIFARRILPILQADNSSSCTECHFAGVELRDFILEDQASTFASLKASGMINVDKPDESKLLRFIGRKPEKPDPLIEKVRQTELVAFQAWIRAAVREPELLKATSNVETGTSLPPEVIRHARKDRVLSSFVDNIWNEMGRCINCHSPDRNRQKIGRNGFTKEDVDAISWIVPQDPAATLKKLLDGGNIDTSDPAASLVLTKPAGLEEHGGGPKFFPGSTTYRNFLGFLTDYAAITSGGYRSADDLPAPARELTLLSEQQLRITNIPAAYSGMALQVDIYRRDDSTRNWSDHRWATGFSRVNGKQHVWQNPIIVTAPADSPLTGEIRKRKLLPSGEYLIRIHIDRDRKTENDPTYEPGKADFVTEVEISGDWKPGYQPPKTVEFPKS